MVSTSCLPPPPPLPLNFQVAPMMVPSGEASPVRLWCWCLISSKAGPTMAKA
jgi:hypothetical protein